MKKSLGRTVFLSAAFLAFLLVPRFGPAIPKAGAPQGAKQDLKDAGKDTKDAAKKSGRAVEKTAKKATHKSAHVVRKGAQKVEGKTQP